MTTGYRVSIDLKSWEEHHEAYFLSRPTKEGVLRSIEEDRELANAKRGTYYAKWIQSGKRLTGEHLAKARKIALYHSRQLVKIAQSSR